MDFVNSLGIIDAWRVGSCRRIDWLTLPLQPRRLIIAPAADGCKRLLGCRWSRPGAGPE